ncbi:hypothetical protein A8C56_03930 [Niabella ginsenosidivorans]|uniref:Uncharacterized protein n=1 Tax=Niabella ginsenosidivorans TaxID=1176587 RepID=A0A1A9HYT5_9BACT|nr:hypothetical protein A8C56_03930 [Niabella ginsenosidivorans]
MRADPFQKIIITQRYGACAILSGTDAATVVCVRTNYLMLISIKLITAYYYKHFLNACRH